MLHYSFQTVTSELWECQTSELQLQTSDFWAKQTKMGKCDKTICISYNPHFNQKKRKTLWLMLRTGSRKNNNRGTDADTVAKMTAEKIHTYVCATNCHSWRSHQWRRFELYFKSQFIFMLFSPLSTSNQTLRSHVLHSQPLHTMENPLYVLSSSSELSTHIQAFTHTALNQ